MTSSIKIESIYININQEKNIFGNSLEIGFINSIIYNTEEHMIYFINFDGICKLLSDARTVTKKK